MGMAASSLRFAQLTARKNQVEFEGQQINQQRLVLSQKSSAIYNDMLTKQVPTAPDPSQFTKIVYKFNNGNGTSQIINLARKAAGAYNYNITYKQPATSKVLSRSKFQNVNFVKTIGATAQNAYTANINGVSRDLTAVGDPTKLSDYQNKLAIYNQLKQIDETRSAIARSSKENFDTSSFKGYAQEAGLTSKLFTKDGDKYTIDPDDELAVALFKAAGVKAQGGKTIGQEGFDYSEIELDSSQTGIPKNVQALIGVIAGGTLVDSSGKTTEINANDANNVFEAIAKQLSGNAQQTTAAEYKKETLDPAFTAYQSSCATPGITNIGEGQALYSYKDDNGDTCYMYVPMENIAEDVNSSYADEVSIYENATTYLEGQTETEQQDANVILSDEGQISKITFADGTVVTPEVVTEMDQDAYDAAMVEYEYKKDVYEKEMNDANAKVKIIQAQDQKLEVRLKQLDTEQKALSTEIDAVKSVRDKSIESSFKTFG